MSQALKKAIRKISWRLEATDIIDPGDIVWVPWLGSYEVVPEEYVGKSGHIFGKNRPDIRRIYASYRSAGSFMDRSYRFPNAV